MEGFLWVKLFSFEGGIYLFSTGGKGGLMKNMAARNFLNVVPNISGREGMGLFMDGDVVTLMVPHDTVGFVRYLIYLYEDCSDYLSCDISYTTSFELKGLYRDRFRGICFITCY